MAQLGQWRDHRTVTTGILWKLRTGALWRDLPERYGPWQTCADRLYRWRRDSICWRRSACAPYGGLRYAWGSMLMTKGFTGTGHGQRPSRQLASRGACTR